MAESETKSETAKLPVRQQQAALSAAVGADAITGRGAGPPLVRRAMQATRSLTAQDVLQMQRTVGNRATRALVDKARSSPSVNTGSPYQVERTTGNQAGQRSLQAAPSDREASSASDTSPGLVHHASRRGLPAQASAQSDRQPTIAVTAPGDLYAQDADRIADTVMPVPDRGTPPVARAASVPEPLPSILGGQEKRVGRKGIEGEEEPVKQEKDIVQKGIEGEDEPVEQEKDIAEKGGGGADDPRVVAGQQLLGLALTRSIQPGTARPRSGPHTGARSTAAPWVQRQPAPPPVVPVAAPAGRAALNFLPILHDLAPPSWGRTINDDPVFDITAYASGATWKCVITQADQQSHQGTRLLAGVVEVTPALVAAEASCPVLQTMITSLNSVANHGGHSGFYMLAAVQAHEDVHITQYRAGLPAHYATLRTAIEGLTVPLASHADAAAAKAAIKALPAYTTAMATFHAGDVAVNNASGAHSPVAPFNTAEHGVVDPMITTIRARRTALGCP